MRSFERYIAALLLAAACAGLAATCGQKGPLRTPDETALAAPPPATHR